MLLSLVEKKAPPAHRYSIVYGTLIFDIESNGLLDTMNRIHTLCIREYETGQCWTFRNNDKMNNIWEGIVMLMRAECIVGHNIMQFDIEAIKLIYPQFEIPEECLIRDTLVIVRHIFSDQKDKDYRLWERGKLPGQLIGAATLESWGYRMGLQKGDYKVMMEERAKALGITDPIDVYKFVW